MRRAPRRTVGRRHGRSLGARARDRAPVRRRGRIGRRGRSPRGAARRRRSDRARCSASGASSSRRTRRRPPTSTASSRRAVDRCGRLDVMVCNAGIAGPLVEGAARDDGGGLGRDHGRQPARCLPRLQARSRPDGRADPVGEVRGRVIMISSQQGLIGTPGHVAYAASKGGVVNFVHQVAVDFGPRVSSSTPSRPARS